MKRLKAILSAHKITALCIAVLMMVSLAFASISIAKSNAKEVEMTKKGKGNCLWYQIRTYYSDASHTTSVGSRRWFCDGEVGTSGTVTIFFVEQTCECIEE